VYGLCIQSVLHAAEPRWVTAARFDHWHEPALGSGFANALKAAPQSKDHIVAEAAQTPSSRAKSNPIGGSPFEFSKFLVGKFEFPSEFRELAEKNALQAKETCEKMKSASEDMTDGFKDAYATAAKGAGEYGTHLIEAARTNSNAAFDYAIGLISSKSLSEAVELSANHLRMQFEALSVQSKELTALAQKVASEAAEPIKERVNTAFRQAA
jgi:phasin